MSKRIRFFALEDDLLVALTVLEAEASLRYFEMAHYEVTAPFRSFRKAREIPDIGIADSPTAIACTAFLICAAHMSVLGRDIRQTDGRIVVAIDQLENPDSVTMTPAGLFPKTQAILEGTIATTGVSAESLKLFGLFRKTISRQFAKVDGAFIGRRAWSAHLEGARLTASIGSPETRDLVVIQPERHRLPWRGR